MPACVHGWSPLGACPICTPPGSGVGPPTGTATVDVDGERYPVRVTRTDSGTYFEVWQPAGESWIRMPLQPAPGGQVLTDDERRYLAMHARYESNRQDDVRYWDADPQKRLTLKRRWREIADWLHPDPWGPLSPAPNVRLGVVEDGRVMAWTSGEFTKKVRVLRDTDDEMPLVECPDCGHPVPVGDTGYVRCSVVAPCPDGWRVLVVRVPES